VLIEKFILAHTEIETGTVDKRYRNVFTDYILARTVCFPLTGNIFVLFLDNTPCTK